MNRETIHLDIEGKSPPEIMREMTRKLDAGITKILQEAEWSAHCDGCAEDELASLMHDARQRVQAVRDRFLEQRRAELKDLAARITDASA